MLKVRCLDELRRLISAGFVSPQVASTDTTEPAPRGATDLERRPGPWGPVAVSSAVLDLIVTNVPRPDVPLYTLGPDARGVSDRSSGRNQGLGVAALCYVGNFNLGVSPTKRSARTCRSLCQGSAAAPCAN
jgi:WS/DGAT C-terminal domain